MMHDAVHGSLLNESICLCVTGLSVSPFRHPVGSSHLHSAYHFDIGSPLLRVRRGLNPTLDKAVIPLPLGKMNIYTGEVIRVKLKCKMLNEKMYKYIIV